MLEVPSRSGLLLIGNVPDDHEPIGVRKRERLQQRRIDQAEDHACWRAMPSASDAAAAAAKPGLRRRLRSP